MDEPCRNNHPGEVRLCFVGDIFGGRGEVTIDPEVTSTLGKADLVVGNLESPITSQPSVDSGKIALKSEPGLEDRLPDWGFGLVSLANNHTCDCGWIGLKETMDRLDAVGVKHLGAGENVTFATRPEIVDIRGLRLGFLSYAWVGTQAKQALADAFGCAPLEESLVSRQIEQLRSEVNHVIVMPHWGFCDYEYPTADVHRLGRQMIEAGATVVVGHHSHRIQGIYQPRPNRLIAYSLGDFLFAPYERNGRVVVARGPHTMGLVLRLRLDSQGVAGFDTIFTRQNNESTVENDPDGVRLLRLREISFALQRDDYDRFWKTTVRERLFRRMSFWICPWNWRQIRKGTLAGLWLMLRDIMTAKDSRNKQR